MINLVGHAVSTSVVTLCGSYWTTEPQLGVAVPRTAKHIAVTMRSTGTPRRSTSMRTRKAGETEGAGVGRAAVSHVRYMDTERPANARRRRA